VKDVTIVSAGTPPPNPAELVGSQRMDEILRHVQQQADVVIIDAPPTLPVTDAAVLAQRVDGVLVVVRDGHTKLAAAKQAVDQLRHVQANVIGVVVNGVSSGRMRSAYGYHGYSQYDYNSYTDAAPRKSSGRTWFRRKPKHEQNVELHS
jgi:capsular exopolysaccharide synthesis family protein